jgi:hypothetical protein
MPFIPVPGGIGANLRFTLNGQLCENTLYFRQGEGTFAVAADTIGATITEQLIIPLATHQSNRLSWTSIHLMDLNTADGPVAEFVTGYPIVGGNDTEAAENGVALVVTLRSEARGRTGRGRNYVAGIIRGAVASSRFDPAMVTAVTLLYNNLRAAAFTAGHNLCIVSRYVDGAPRVGGILRDVLTVDSVTNATRSQRRRNPGIGS